MDYNKKKLDSVQLEYLAKAEKLQAELIQHGFMASRIEKGEDRTDFHVIFFDGMYDYRIHRDYSGNVQVLRAEWKSYPNVSSSTRRDIWKKYKDGNMKVITAKKLQAKIDAENAFNDEMAALNEKAQDAQVAFIESVNALGVPVKWKHERGGYKDGEIVGGVIERNGIEFSFEFSNDGYISKKLRVMYTVDNTLEAFMALSDNRYNV